MTHSRLSLSPDSFTDWKILSALVRTHGYSQIGLSPKLWTRLKHARMRQEGFHTEAETRYLTIQRKSPTAATMRLSVSVTKLSTMRLRLCFLHPVANEAD